MTKIKAILLAMATTVVLTGCGGADDASDKKANAEPTYTNEAEARVIEEHERIINEADGVIVSIKQEDGYEIVNVLLDDGFEELPTELKQRFVDNYGKAIEGSTRSTLFARGSSDFIYVYFKNSKGEHLAKTGHSDIGWAVE